MAHIAPAVLHPVEEVLVKVGMRVKKDQPLVKIDADEPEADVKAKEAVVAELQASLARLEAEPREEEQKEARANLECVRVAAEQARHLLERLEPLHRGGSIPEQRYHEARAAHAKTEAEQRAAAARLDRLLKRPFAREVAELKARIAAAEHNLKAAKAELEHYTVTAPIDGVVSRLDVYPGTVSRPGTSLWGEILDLSEIDVRCELTPQQADSIQLGQTAVVRLNGTRDLRWKGEIVLIGIAANPKNGLVPVLVRFKNPGERLRCFVDVRVNFDSSKPMSKVQTGAGG
jgi:multidrug resistance efflux pump